jgi:DASS family divalent anion:Na+ symporter
MGVRFYEVLAAHWPVGALLLGLVAVMAVVALWRGRADAESGSVTRAELFGWSCVLVLPPLVYVLGLASGLGVEAAIFTAMLAAAVLLWVFGVVEEFVPALVVVVAALFIGLAPPNVALAGFSSPSLLLLIGVYALSAVISSSGLSYRLMLRLLLRLPDKPFWHQAVLLVSGYALSPLIPSTNTRLSLLKPLFNDMAAGLKLPLRGPAITALLAAMFGGALLFSPMMATSKSSNIAALNLLPSQVQAEFSGLFWLVAAAAAALFVTIAHLFVVSRLFPTTGEAPLPRQDLEGQLAAMGRLKPSEWVAATGFVFFLGGCATVSWHHVAPAYLAGCVLLGLLLTGTLLRKDFQQQIDWPMIFFLLGMDSMMRIMNHLGLTQALASAAGQIYGFVDGKMALFIIAALVTTLTVRLVLPVTAGMLTSAIILLPVAAAQGVNPWICIFCTAIFSDISFFRHQGTNGILQIHSSGLFGMADERGFIRYHFLMNAARVAAVFASIPWWQWLGLL